MRVLLILCIIISSNLFGKVFGINNFETVSGIKANEVNLMMQSETKELKNIFNNEIKPKLEQKLNIIYEKYTLIRKIKELKKRNYINKKEEVEYLRKTKKLYCNYLTLKITKMDRKIIDFINSVLTFMLKKGLIDLEEWYFYANFDTGLLTK